ncbi:hypothetical protein [Levilactobacillus yonginensis]|uniref:hypothetical protein n=1 Tax=Levilactobacillus yonginensis TaxID=1054041 RepID=UPI000F768C27|nr:hypothetical protein [Levilactobacillus yonginensis]
MIKIAVLRQPGTKPVVGTGASQKSVLLLDLKPRNSRVFKLVRGVNWLKKRQSTPLSRLVSSRAASDLGCGRY